jgi:hypothetical protein
METRRPKLGWALGVAGVIGVVTGLVPFVGTSLRLVVDENLWKIPGTEDLAAHGMESMSLSLEWCMLSSAMGTYLGVLLLLAGFGWVRGRPWALPVSIAYVLGGLAVNFTDLVIFLFRAQSGLMRTLMILFDGIAFLIPLFLGIYLLGITRNRTTTRAPSGVGPR